MNNAAHTSRSIQPHYDRDAAAAYCFDVEVIDLRSGERMQIFIDANTKASAGKRARELGYSVCSMSFA